MKNKEYLSKILPHKEPMILIDDVLDYSLDEKYLRACVTITEDCMFFNKEIQGVDSVAGIEYMAQSIGCYAFLKSGRKEPKIGFLLGTRLYNNAIDKFELGKTYQILVKEVFVAEIFSFECFIYNDLNEEIASATINVYQSEDNNIEEMING